MSTKMSAISLTNIVTESRKSVPEGTLLKVRLGTISDTVTIEVELPDQGAAVRYENLRIVGGVVTLPVRLAFLSHAKEDVGFVRHLAGSLLRDGVMTWFDEKDLLPGDAWKRRIDEAIENSDYVIVFLSRQSVSKTGYFQRELRYALEQRDLRPEGVRYIIPVLIDDCDPPHSLGDIHWLRSGETDWYQKLLAAIRSR